MGHLGVVCVMVGSRRAMVENTDPRDVLEYWLHHLQLGNVHGFSYL